MVSEITSAVAEGFDASRSILLPAASLVLLDYEQVAGETTLYTVVDGWIAEQSPDSETSTVKVRITERAGLTSVIMNQVARFSISGTAYRVVPGGITPPFKEPRVWQLQGEELRNV
jgi:hypothetical protein